MNLAFAKAAEFVNKTLNPTDMEKNLAEALSNENWGVSNTIKMASKFSGTPSSFFLRENSKLTNVFVDGRADKQSPRAPLTTASTPTS